MPKFEVTIVQTTRRYITVEIRADDWEKAEDVASNMIIKAEDWHGDETTREVEDVEEIEG